MGEAEKSDGRRTSSPRDRYICKRYAEGLFPDSQRIPELRLTSNDQINRTNT